MVHWNQAITHSEHAGTQCHLQESSVVFRYGDNLAASRGIMSIRLQVPGHFFMVLDCHVVMADVPFLLRLDVLRAFGLRLDFNRDCLSSASPPWSLPLHYVSDHAFVILSSIFTNDSPVGHGGEAGNDAMDSSIRAQTVHFTATQLRRLHLHFYQKSASKLFSLLRRAEKTQASPLVCRILTRITEGCESCRT